MAFYKEALKVVRAFVFDVDGVLARSEVLLHPDGDLMRSMNTKDGYAIQYAIKSGFPVGIISGAKSESIRKRFNNLGTNDVFLDSKNKWDDLILFLDKHKIDISAVLYMGDDLPDLDLMKKVAIPVCPQDAAADVQAISMYISPYPGGTGCVRDVIEQVLRAQGRWLNETLSR